jgi:hypothetical protein
MKLTFKLGTKNQRTVEVNPSDPLYVLLDKLKITDKRTKFIFKGITYGMSSIETFQEIGLTYDTKITVSNQAISG